MFAKTIWILYYSIYQYKVNSEIIHKPHISQCTYVCWYDEVQNLKINEYKTMLTRTAPYFAKSHTGIHYPTPDVYTLPACPKQRQDNPSVVSLTNTAALSPTTRVNNSLFSRGIVVSDCCTTTVRQLPGRTGLARVIPRSRRADKDLRIGGR